MIRRVIIIVCISLLVACKPANKLPDDGVAAFDYFEYKGEDNWFNHALDNKTEYFNPVIVGFYPDPSVCRKGNDYFLVNSTFAYYPGIPIFHSKDLANWTQIGNVLNRPSQVYLEGQSMTGGLYAPDIQYNSHNDTFYMVNTNLCRDGNYFVKTKDPFQNNWSEPVLLDIVGIDPSFFFDDDGKAYIVHHNIPKQQSYSSHCCIYLCEFDLQSEKAGKDSLLIDAATIADRPLLWIEGPHLYKYNGKYYLLIAEGGTGKNHCVMMYVADKIHGPYKSVDTNPILTQRDLPDNRPDAITCTGHADLIQAPDGEWYAVFLGCRPDAETHSCPMGRETFMLPMTWTDGQPLILPQGEPVPIVSRPRQWQSAPLDKASTPATGNYTWRDEFRDSTLAPQWVFLHEQPRGWMQLPGNCLLMRPDTLSLTNMAVSPAFVARRQSHANFTTTTCLRFRPTADGEFAGMVYYADNEHFLTCGKTQQEGKAMLTVTTVSPGHIEPQAQYVLEANEANKPIYLRMRVRGGKTSFEYSFNNKDWAQIALDLDSSDLKTAFTGCMVGLYATK